MSQQEQKQKDFEDLRFLSSHGVPSSKPVALDIGKGLLIEMFEEGIDLGTFLRSRDYSSETKIDRFRKGMETLKSAQNLGRQCGEALVDNFLVTPSGQVKITDMEKKSVLSDPVTHELAFFVFSTPRDVPAKHVVKAAADLYPKGVVKKLPRYVLRPLFFLDPVASYQICRTIQELE